MKEHQPLMHNFTPQQRAWIDALRSGEYKQTSSVLTRVASDGTTSHCCLGVACELAAADPDGPVVKVEDDDGTGQRYYILKLADECGPSKAATALLTGDLMSYLGMSTENGSFTLDAEDRYGLRAQSLADLNDTAGLTFDQIADVVEYFAEDIFEDAPAEEQAVAA